MDRGAEIANLNRLLRLAAEAAGVAEWAYDKGQADGKSSLFPVWRRVANRGIVAPSTGGARWMTAFDGFGLAFTP